MSTALGIGLGIVLILALTAATGYFVAQEFAYVAVDRNALRQLADEGDAAAERALRVTSQLSFTLSAAQFGITVTALLVGYVSEPLVGAGIAELLDPSMSYAARLSLSVTAVLVFSTVVQMVFGELAPKNYAIARTVPLARSLSRSTLLYLMVAGPVVRLFDRASTTLLRRVGIEPVEELEQGATAEDLTRIIDESHAGGLLDDDLSDVLEGGLRFRELDAGDVMTPRVRVTTIHADAMVSDLVALLDSGWSRFPVTGRDGDDIVGVAGIAEVLATEPDRRATTTVGVGRVRPDRRADERSAPPRPRADPGRPPAARRRRGRARWLRRHRHLRGHRRGGRRRDPRRGRRTRARRRRDLPRHLERARAPAARRARHRHRPAPREQRRVLDDQRAHPRGPRTHRRRR